MNEFQERLQELLIENSLSRLGLSKKIGVSFETINGYFNKDYYPEICVAIKMADYFGCSLNYLMGFSDDYSVNDSSGLSFVETLKKLMHEKSISIEKLMNTLGMSEANFYRWQRGASTPSMSSIVSIARFFDVTIDYLIAKQYRNDNKKD